jgi:hypothetical protein
MARSLGRFLLRILLAVLIAYWAIFFGYTIFRFFEGGTPAVLAWYKHVGARWVTSAGSEIGFPVWEPVRFTVDQVVILVLTVLAWLGSNKCERSPSSNVSVSRAATRGKLRSCRGCGIWRLA